MKIDLDVLKPLMSTYISSGYKEDSVVISSLEKTDVGFIARVDVENFFLPGDGQYHFTAFHTELCISQLIIIHGCLALGFKKKTGEAYMREFQMKLKKKIHKTQCIIIKTTYDPIRVVGNNAFIRGQFSVEDDSFYGKISAVLPINKEQQ
jgi:hypothetical protein